MFPNKDLLALLQIRSNALLTEAPPRVMVAKHDSLRSVDIGNRSHHVDVFIPKISIRA